MIRQKIQQLLKDFDFDPDVRKVVDRVIQIEYSRLDTKRPRGIYDEICRIIEQEVNRNETSVS